jgi:hypothetical protein
LNGLESEGSVSFCGYRFDVVVFSFAFRCHTLIE